jgi:hypothetical protein
MTCLPKIAVTSLRQTDVTQQVPERSRVLMRFAHKQMLQADAIALKWRACFGQATDLRGS